LEGSTATNSALNERVQALIDEVCAIIPAYTHGRGSFSSMPPGYDQRNPGAWQREVLSILDVSSVERLRPNNGDIAQLTELVNLWSLTLPTDWSFEDPHVGVRSLPTWLLQPIVSYALLEMLLRALLGGYRKNSSYDKLLAYFETNCPLRDLARDLATLNSAMITKENGRSLDLYKRLRAGRDQLFHGNVLRSHEFEGALVVLLVDLVLLHTMREAILSEPGRS
jgi:hypothetical protein